MTTCLGKSYSFGLPRVPSVNCCQFMYLVISLLDLRAGCGIGLYQFLIIAYLFTLHQVSQNIGSNTFIRIYSSHFAQENLQGKAQRTHTSYADSDVLQNFCVNSAIRSVLQAYIFCL